MSYSCEGCKGEGYMWDPRSNKNVLCPVCAGKSRHQSGEGVAEAKDKGSRKDVVLQEEKK
jgi:hypothetical protein